MRRFVAAAAVAALILGGLAESSRAGTDGWEVTQLLGTSSGTDHRSVSDVATTSPIDAWAVGGQFRAARGVPFAQHWDGTQWSEVPLPADLVGSLDRVTASSATDVWAFGNENSPTFRGYLLHWDGTTWTNMPEPPFGGSTGVSLSAHNLWVPSATGTDREYVQHWNGKRWRAYRVRMNSLNAMAAVSRNDVWLVGRNGASAAAMHWNGRRWRTVPLPAVPVPEGAETSLIGVVASSPDDVWAVGGYDWLPFDEQRQHRTVAMHWDGTSWSVVATPEGQHSFSAAAGDGAGGIWVVQQAPDVAPLFGKAELLRYTGGAWRSFPVTGISDGRLLEEAQLANVPGTQSMWGAATFCFPTTCDHRAAMISFG